MSQEHADADARRGTLLGALAYLIWGVFPLYFSLLRPASALEVLGHRVLWSLLVCAGLLLVGRRVGAFVRLLRDPRRVLLVGLAGLLIGANWTVYVLGVTTGRVSETALGYFLNPLVTVALGVVVLRERLRPMQWLAVALGVLAAAYLTVDYGRFPWISVVLALSFAAYGLIKKQAGGSMDALQSLTMETLLLVPVAVGVLAVLSARGATTFTGHGAAHTLLLASTGIATAVPLLLFGAAARRVPLVTIGLLQFCAPVLQLLCGVVLMGEHMPASRWAGFAIVWLALVILLVDTARAVRRRANSVIPA